MVNHWYLLPVVVNGWSWQIIRSVVLVVTKPLLQSTPIDATSTKVHKEENMEQEESDHETKDIFDDKENNDDEEMETEDTEDFWNQLVTKTAEENIRDYPDDKLKTILKSECPEQPRQRFLFPTC